jgi:hypothetical protein
MHGRELQLTAGITMLTHFENRIIVFAPFVLPQDNWSFGSGKTNGVMPANVMMSYTAAKRFLFESESKGFVQIEFVT